jgi:hypothetical protein
MSSRKEKGGSKETGMMKGKLVAWWPFPVCKWVLWEAATRGMVYLLAPESTATP